MATQVVLRDGTPAIMWPVLPSDRNAGEAFYAALDSRSRFHRFHSTVPRLSEAMLTELVDKVDGVDHVALVLVLLSDEEPGEPAGVARAIRYANDRDTADLAVTVLPNHRGRGVASALLQELLARRPLGVSRVLTHVAVDNPAAVRMLKRLGPTTVRVAGGGQYEVEVRLPDSQVEQAGQDQ